MNQEKVNFQNVDKVKNQIEKETQKSDNEYEKLNSVIDVQVAEKIKYDPKIQTGIVEKVDTEWAKKIFDYWEWKRTHFEFWEKYLENQGFWKKLKSDNKYNESKAAEVFASCCERFRS